MEKNRPPTLRWDARLIKRAQEEVHAAQTYGHRPLTLGGEYFTLCSRISYFLDAPLFLPFRSVQDALQDAQSPAQTKFRSAFMSC